MARGVLNVIFIIIMLGIFALTFYTQIPGQPIQLKEDAKVPDEVRIIQYGSTPLFAENLRFNHNNISFTISPACSQLNEEKMRQAFGIFQKLMPPITFYENNFNPDIEVQCVEKQEMTGKGLFAAGEGGPSRIINASTFKTIKEGTIYLYQEERCDYPVVELHELLHVFGFDHTQNPDSLMNPVSNCNQRITPDMQSYIAKLYSIKPAADASIKQVNATKKGRYLDFSITVTNEGMLNINAINLTLLQDDKIVQVFEMGKIQIGYGRTLQATNVKLPGLTSEKITFVLDLENNVEELIGSNNIQTMEM